MHSYATHAKIVINWMDDIFHNKANAGLTYRLYDDCRVARGPGAVEPAAQP